MGGVSAYWAAMNRNKRAIGPRRAEQQEAVASALGLSPQAPPFAAVTEIP